MSAGICRGCGCTDTSPCDGGCGWVDEERTICSRCTAAAGLATALIDAVRAAPHLLDDRRAAPSTLVLVCRQQIEEVAAAYADIATLQVSFELERLREVLADRFPAEFNAASTREEGLIDLTIRLLTHEPARRIVLASEVH